MKTPHKPSKANINTRINTKHLPNIIVILADDLGYGDIGCYNPASRIPTPNIDRLADQGMRFTDAHSPSAVCTPSRYGLLTGCYGWRSPLPYGVLYGYEPPLISPDRLTLASLLRQEGYKTAAIGKWHLGLGFSAKPQSSIDFSQPLPWQEASREFEDQIDFSQGIHNGPTRLGFDTFFGTAGCPTCQPPYAFIEDEHFVTEPVDYDEHPPLTGRPGRMAPGWRHDEADTTFTNRAVSFIKHCQTEDRPFFLFLASDAPHEPCTTGVIPTFAQGRSEAGPRGDLVWLFDWMVGEVLDTLEQVQALSNTIIVVTSDNGALPGDLMADRVGPEEAVYQTYGHLSCGDWRGYKSHIWEGGHREPLIITWPGHIEPKSVSPELICLTDLLATFAGLLGISLAHNAAEDSLDFSELLLGRKISPIRTDLVHHSQKGVYSLRKGAWKCIFGTLGSGGWPPPTDTFPEPVVFNANFTSPQFLAQLVTGQLYNLELDPGEQHNLWSERLDIVTELAGLLDTYRRNGRSVIRPSHLLAD